MNAEVRKAIVGFFLDNEEKISNINHISEHLKKEDEEALVIVNLDLIEGSLLVARDYYSKIMGLPKEFINYNSKEVLNKFLMTWLKKGVGEV